MALNDKQTRFVAEYLVDLNATQAAIRSGYSEDTAGKIGSENLQKPEIAAAIAIGKAKQLKSADLSAARVLEELRRLAMIDLRSFFDEHGNLKPVQDLTPEQGAALASFEVIKKNAEAGDGKIDTIHKFKVWDKPRSLEMLAKHFALLVDRIDVTGQSIPDRLNAARAKARARQEKREG
jgi:phage terminase small subunit